MRKKEYSIRISDVLGVALLVTTALAFLYRHLAAFLSMSAGALLLKLLLLLPLYLLPVLLVFLGCKRFSLPIPRLSRGALGYNEAAMLSVSTFGAVVLMEVLYGSVFPSTFRDIGVAQVQTTAGFALLFLQVVVLPAVLEELLFRGVILRTLTTYRALLAILMSSLASALMRFSLEAFPLAFFCGFLLGSVYYATGSLGSVIGVHLMANAAWFLSETVGVFISERYAIFLRVLVASCVLLFAFGLPFLKKTVQALLADEHDAGLLPSAHFWGIPISTFFVIAILLPLLGITV